MLVKDWFRPPRHLLVLFFGITTISTATLAWLSWQLVRQDRDVAMQRAQEQRENAADVSVAAFQKAFAKLEADLASVASASEETAKKAEVYSQALTKDSVLILMDATHLQAYPERRLLYYPMLSELNEPFTTEFTMADALEVQKKDYGQAIDLLEVAAQSRDSRTKAEALIRLARNLHKAGRTSDALKAYERLSQLESIRVHGTPVDLLARGAICDLLAKRDPEGRLQREASTLYTDLQSGRWTIRRSVYDVYADQARRILGSNVPVSDESVLERTIITDAAQAFWSQWNEGQGIAGRSTLWASERPVLAITYRSADRTAALLIGPTHLSTLFNEARRTAEDRNAQVALTDSQERPIVGRVEDPPGSYAVRLSSATGLPWTVYATSIHDSAGAGGFSVRSRLVMAGLLAIALLVLGGSYLIGRAVARELAVAKLQSDFVTAVSHEFRTPLTAMRQLSELLAKGRVINEDVRQRYYEVLENETARLHRLVEGLLKFGRMEAGAVRYEFEAVDMTALLRSLLEEFTPEADRRGYHIEFNAQPAIPHARVDREALGCVIWNLLDNAVKYSPGRDKIWLDLSRENGSVAIRVRDEGVGIASEEQQGVFQKFVRGEEAMNLGVQGAGIGLAMARQIVATHGGEIKLESKPGAGSTFTVLLPALES